MLGDGHSRLVSHHSEPNGFVASRPKVIDQSMHEISLHPFPPAYEKFDSLTLTDGK